MFYRLILLILLSWSLINSTAQTTGAISGKVFDQLSNDALAGATVLLQHNEEFMGAVADSNGEFRIDGLGFGNYSIQVEFLGYEQKEIVEIGVYTVQGPFLVIQLMPSSLSLESVVVSERHNPSDNPDPMALVSARKISIEETKRFAGSLGDPSRMALSYAGVDGGRGDNNDLIVRGIGSKYVRWKLEGLEIPNPNHFGVYGSSGGLLSIVNSSNLGSSTFYTGAVPAHTGNAISGVFDLSLRTGNPDQFVHRVKTSVLGLSLNSEGPFGLLDGGSYVVGYRYSTLGLMKQTGIVFQSPEYQDLTFKLNLPTKDYGAVSIYAIGGKGKWLEQDFFRRIDSSTFNINQRGDTVFGFDEIAADNFDRYDLGVIGLKHAIPIGSRTVLSNHMSYSTVVSSPRETDINRDDFTIYTKELAEYRTNVVRYQPKVSVYLKKHALISGMIFTNQKFNSSLIRGFPDQSQETILDHHASSALIQSFLSWKNSFWSGFETILGIHHTYFDLSDQHLFEPRLAISRALSQHSTLSLASGLHSTTESPEAYLLLSDSNTISLRNLKMTRSVQSVLSYKVQLGANLFFTAEIYHQYLFDVPIAADSSNYSLINDEVSFTNRSLVNAGKGLNYGLDLTLEKTFSDAYYVLLTASLFQSEYKLMEPYFRKTKYSRSYVVNLLGGKEFRIRQNKIFGINIRSTFSGGQPYIPVLLEESMQENREVRDERRAYSRQLPPYIGIDLSLSYRWIRAKSSHEVKLDIFRLFEQNYYDEVYVQERLNRDGNIEPASTQQLKYGDGQTATTILPVVSYELTF